MRSLLGLCLLACAATAPAATLVGSAFHGELLQWPRDAVFEAELVELPTRVVQRVRVEHPAPGIVSFRMVYDASALREDRRYAVRARVTSEGRTIFASDLATDPFDGGEPKPLALRLQRVAPPASSPETP